MGKWEFVSREYHNDTYDLTTHDITYPGGDRMRKQYLILKEEKRIPKELLKERSWSTTRLNRKDKGEWIDGKIKSKAGFKRDKSKAENGGKL